MYVYIYIICVKKSLLSYILFSHNFSRNPLNNFLFLELCSLVIPFGYQLPGFPPLAADEQLQNVWL